MDSATTCPLCGAPNNCGAAAGKDECWCFSAALSPRILEQIPQNLRGSVCVCQTCAQRADAALGGNGANPNGVPSVGPSTE